MATALENLQSAYQSVTAKMAEVMASLQPDYTIEGQSISKDKYYAMLSRQEESLRKAIIASQPYMFVTQVL
jgi:hypothetical protein